MSVEEKSSPPPWVQDWDLVSLRRHHLSDGAMAYDEYASRYQAQLQFGMSSAKRLYLDTNFWIHFRDIERGIARSTPYRGVYDRVRAAVADRRLICIYHHTSFIEAARQDIASLRVLAGVVDELSEGVAISPRPKLLSIDVREFVADRLRIENSSSSERWTKVMLMFRGSLPERDGVPEVVMKLVLDTLWNGKLSDVIDMIEASIGKYRVGYGDDLIAAMEEVRKQQRRDGLSRLEIGQRAFGDFYDMQYGRRVAFLVSLLHQAGMCAEPVAAVQQLKEEALDDFRNRRLGRFLSQGRIMSELHTEAECANPDQPLRANDLVDHEHAAAALPNADAFFTEANLKHKLSVLGLASDFGCLVASTPVDAITCLDQLGL